MKNLYLLPLLFFAITAFCQNPAGSISGKVTDAESGQALPFANVYIDKTSISTQTDESGNYRLTNLPGGNLEVRISFTGYETVKKQIEIMAKTDKDLSVQMIPGIGLNEIVVNAKGNKFRDRQLEIISRELIGDNILRKKCRITNPEVIMTYDDAEGHLRARSADPIIFENRALGYRVFYELEDFDYFNGTAFFGGNTRFENLEAENVKEKAAWMNNRLTAYHGSLKHLLTSVIANQTAAEGFKIYSVHDTLARAYVQFGVTKRPNITDPEANRIEITPANLVRPGPAGNARIIAFRHILEVFYTKRRGASPYSDMRYEYSELILPQKFMVVTEHGWVLEPRGLTVDGYLTKDRFGMLLPADWVENN